MVRFHLNSWYNDLICNLPFLYSEEQKNYFIFKEPIWIRDIVLVSDNEYLQDYLDIFEISFLDYFVVDKELPYGYIKGNSYRIINNSSRDDTSLSCLYDIRIKQRIS